MASSRRASAVPEAWTGSGGASRRRSRASARPSSRGRGWLPSGPRPDGPASTGCRASVRGGPCRRVARPWLGSAARGSRGRGRTRSGRPRPRPRPVCAPVSAGAIRSNSRRTGASMDARSGAGRVTAVVGAGSARPRAYIVQPVARPSSRSVPAGVGASRSGMSPDMEAPGGTSASPLPSSVGASPLVRDPVLSVAPSGKTKDRPWHPWPTRPLIHEMHRSRRVRPRSVPIHEGSGSYEILTRRPGVAWPPCDPLRTIPVGRALRRRTAPVSAAPVSRDAAPRRSRPRNDPTTRTSQRP